MQAGKEHIVLLIICVLIVGYLGMISTHKNYRHGKQMYTKTLFGQKNIQVCSRAPVISKDQCWHSDNETNKHCGYRCTDCPKGVDEGWIWSSCK